MTDQWARASSIKWSLDKPGYKAEHPAKVLILVGVEQVLELGVEDLQVLLNQHLDGKF